jgi:phosphatidylserine/phosphatidylglycerophosphate/cardiolipin synthase-like enzyme
MFALLLVVSILVMGCTGQADDLSTAPGLPTEVPSDWYAVYFSEPDSPKAATLRGGPDQYLANAIRQARLSVDVAAYDLDLWSIRDALIDAHQRGLSVRMVTDSDNLDTPEIQDIKEAGIPLLGDRREGLMHNKFTIIDRQEVWTGSLNLTINSAYRNDENLVRIRSADLAENYTQEFDEMFTDDRFGPGSPANTPHPVLQVEDSSLQVYFSPDDGVARQIVRLIQSAQESIYFMAYSFTLDEIADAMLEQAASGVIVSGVLERDQVISNQGGEYDRMRSAGLDVRMDGNPDNLHHKVIIIDGKIVITGSYNFSNNAETRNDENLLVIHNPEVAARFLLEFQRVFDLAHY